MPFGRFTAFRDLVLAVYRRTYKRSHWSIDAWLSPVVVRTFRGLLILYIEDDGSRRCVDIREGLLPGMMLDLGSQDIARSGQVWPSNERARTMSKSAIRLLPIAFGFLLLGACTPGSVKPHGGQSFPLVQPSFMSWPVQHWLCNPDSVGYCPAE